MIPEITRGQRKALDHARALIEAGVPVFIAKPDGDGIKEGWNAKGGHQGTGYWLPKGWQNTVPDETVIDRWKPGQALCAVMGVVVDAIDIDPRSGGDVEALGGILPTVYGRATTPSGGEHLLIASTGTRSLDGFMPGIDVKAGTEGEGRGFIFISPTVKKSKATGQKGVYRWTQAPDLDPILLDLDTSGEVLSALIAAKRSGDGYEGPAWDGPGWQAMTESQQEWARQYVEGVKRDWSLRLAEADEWDDGETDTKGRGWEALSYQWAWVVALLAAAPWTGLDSDSAGELFWDVLPDAMQQDEVVISKAPNDALWAKAARAPVAPPPWDGLDVFSPLPEETTDDGTLGAAIADHEDVASGEVVKRVRPKVNVTEPAHATTWLVSEIGTDGLNGVMARGDGLVYTPRVGREGYTPAADGQDDGPAQVHRMAALTLAFAVDRAYRVHKIDAKGQQRPAQFPVESAARVISGVPLLGIKRLRGVTHTPIVRADGSVVTQPGYDDDSGFLYLPTVHVPEVPAEPSEGDIAKARDLLLEMVQDFPWVSVHDRANWLAGFFTPLLRLLVPPPYKMLLIGAHQAGSGKSLLAWIMREVHGGVFRAEMPTGEEEIGKVITALLDTTTAPVVQIDNVSGRVKSAKLDGLLTSAVWSDRRLGVSEQVNAVNDRLWVMTGNNIQIGGDLRRRVYWSMIDAQMERPEERTGFAIKDLRTWVLSSKGDLLWAMLVLIRAWVAADRPMGAARTSDDYALWLQVTQGILDTAGVEGAVCHIDTEDVEADEDADEWLVFLTAVHRVMGGSDWFVKELVAKVRDVDGITNLDDPEADLSPDELPGGLGSEVRKDKIGTTKSLSKMLAAKRGFWSGGMSIERGIKKQGVLRWSVAGEPVQTLESGEDDLETSELSVETDI